MTTRRLRLSKSMGESVRLVRQTAHTTLFLWLDWIEYGCNYSPAIRLRYLGNILVELLASSFRPSLNQPQIIIRSQTFYVCELPSALLCISIIIMYAIGTIYFRNEGAVSVRGTLYLVYLYSSAILFCLATVCQSGYYYAIFAPLSTTSDGSHIVRMCGLLICQYYISSCVIHVST
jgi:hypothetical protein